MTTTLTRMRSDLRTRRAHRDAVRRLSADLAQFGSASERAELSAVLGRYSDADTADIRRHASLTV